MDLGLWGKVSLITGSTNGIGKAIAIEMAREGADVIINGRKKNTADQVVSEIKEKFPGTNPQVDVLVNNMGIFKPMNYFDISEETWQHLLMSISILVML